MIFFIFQSVTIVYTVQAHKEPIKSTVPVMNTKAKLIMRVIRTPIVAFLSLNELVFMISMIEQIQVMKLNARQKCIGFVEEREKINLKKS